MAVEIVEENTNILIRKIIFDSTGGQSLLSYQGVPADATDSFYFIEYNFEQFTNTPISVKVSEYYINVRDKVDRKLIASIVAAFLKEPILNVMTVLPEV